MIQTKHTSGGPARDPYLESFQHLKRNGIETPPWLFAKRQAGISRHAEVGFPTLKDEDWRFTNVTSIARLPFKPAGNYSRAGLDTDSLRQFAFTQLKATRLVFVNGLHSDELSFVHSLKEGVHIGSLASALHLDSHRLENLLATQVCADSNAFAALNTAFFQDGAFILVPAGCVLQEPIHLLFISTANEFGTHSHPRNLIVASQGSQVTILESFVSVGDAPCCTNTVTELLAEEGAVVEHCKFQDERVDAFHVGTLHARLGRSCDFVHHSIATGGRLARNNIRVTLAGEGINCILNGLYLAKSDQLVDHHMVVEHSKPHCQSHEYFNGILDGSSRGVFHGRILVQPEAQKTDAKQTNKNLLLSDDATIDAKPQLEIYADDVKCTHGATIGQLDEDSVFYLRTRGIGLETARRMLIHAFAGEIIERIKFEPARDELDQLIWERLEQNPHIAAHR